MRLHSKLRPKATDCTCAYAHAQMCTCIPKSAESTRTLMCAHTCPQPPHAHARTCAHAPTCMQTMTHAHRQRHSWVPNGASSDRPKSAPRGTKTAPRADRLIWYFWFSGGGFRRVFWDLFDLFFPLFSVDLQDEIRRGTERSECLRVCRWRPEQQIPIKS